MPGVSGLRGREDSPNPDAEGSGGATAGEERRLRVSWDIFEGMGGL